MHMCAQSLSFPSQHVPIGSITLQIARKPSTTPPPAQTPPYRFLRLRRVCAVVTALIRWSLPLAVFNPHATPFCCGGCGWTLVWRFCQVPKSLLPFPRGVHLCNQNWILRGPKIHPRKNLFFDKSQVPAWTKHPPKIGFFHTYFSPWKYPKNKLKSDQFTKLNLSSSLDRANLNAYNPWEIVSRLQTIDPSPIWKRFYKRLSRSPRTPVFLPSSWRKSLLGNCRVNSARLQV